MIAASRYNDVIRIYNNTQRDDICYNLAYIGSDFSEVLRSPFDQKFRAPDPRNPLEWEFS
jgi:hypothetical protein